ncbi:MAG: flavodoxin [Selenomonadaceae bacterium]|nr:flavodoxin [Selenomonadaceae bacterium]
MKKILLLLLAMFMMSGCGNSAQEKSPVETEKALAAPSTADKKILVVYFSRTGEEYGLGNITKGNTAIVADIIAQKVGADIFEIKAATPYPDNYDACLELAKKELESNARPAVVGNVDNFAQYDTIFIGYPIWYAALPRVILTFIESNDFNGKTIIPFCTHAGSGLTGTERELKEACPNSKVLNGLAIIGKTAQNDSAAVQKDVDAWLKTLGY